MSRLAERDVILRFLEIASDCLGGMDQKQAREIDDLMRQEYGGTKVYIALAGWTNLAERDNAIVADLRARMTVREIAGKYCIGVATVCRIKRTICPTPNVPILSRSGTLNRAKWCREKD